MKSPLLYSLLSLLLISNAFAQGKSDMAKDKAKIKSAVSSAISSVSDDATIMDWPDAEGNMATIREGSNGWTCFPDNPATPGNDPMCLDGPWMSWASGWMGKTDFTIDKMGFGYMLQGGTPESNLDPYAEGPTDDNEWMTDAVPHLMIIVPNSESLAGLPTKPNGGPWVMWKDTPYVHIMVPMPKHHPGRD